MAEYSGFFNALEQSDGSYDRTYDASAFAAYFAKFISNGVYGGDGSADLKVTAGPAGRSVVIKVGSAFIDGYWFTMDETKTVAIPANTGSQAVQNAVCLRLDKSNRNVTIQTKTGSMLPIDNGTIHELVLAVVTVPVAATAISEDMIEDKRPLSEYCGFVMGVVDQINIDEIYTQFKAQWETWFNGIKGTLSEDAATNLYNMITSVQSDIGKIKNELAPVPHYYKYKKVMAEIERPDNLGALMITLPASNYKMQGYTFNKAIVSKVLYTDDNNTQVDTRIAPIVCVVTHYKTATDGTITLMLNYATNKSSSYKLYDVEIQLEYILDDIYDKAWNWVYGTGSGSGGTL